MKFLLFLGSVRDSSPPRPRRLGERVARALQAACAKAFDDHDLQLVDALDYPLDAVFKPHFAYAKDRAPEPLEQLSRAIQEADGYIMLSPEYNHAMSPALAHLLNHFGSSLFAYKPSAIATYSAGQWGGMRAAVGLRGFLSELGCLPVSAMIHVPRAAQALDETGQFQDDPQRWQGYLERTLLQLLWWADATRQQRQRMDPEALIGSFRRDPAERNAPGG